MKQKCILFLIILFWFLSVRVDAQILIWNKDASKDFIALYKKAVYLEPYEVNLLALHYSKEPFEQWKNRYLNLGLKPFFDKYNYSKANEFELKRILPLIKNDITKKQNELLKVKYVIIKTQQYVKSSYSFENKGFQFQDYFKEDLYKDSHYYIINWIPPRLLYNENQIYHDSYVFPSFFTLKENEAEDFIKNNSQKKVEVQIIAKILKSVKLNSSYTSSLDLEVCGLATLILNNTKVLSISPKLNDLENNMVKLCNYYANINEAWPKQFTNIVNKSYANDKKNVVEGGRELKILSNLYNRILCYNELAQIMKWKLGNEFQKVFDNIVKSQKIKTDLYSKYLAISSSASGKYYISRFNKPDLIKKFEIIIKSLDTTTNKFTATYKADDTGAIQNINGSISVDMLSPIIVLYDIDRKFNCFLRMIEPKKYYGCQEYVSSVGSSVEILFE